MLTNDNLPNKKRKVKSTFSLSESFIGLSPDDLRLLAEAINKLANHYQRERDLEEEVGAYHDPYAMPAFMRHPEYAIEKAGV